MIEKGEKIKRIVRMISEEIISLGFNNHYVKDIYHEIVNTDFCAKYFVEAPISSYNKSGPHIFISVNEKNGFGLYTENLNFNNGLYDLAKYWAELLSPDFIIIFSDNIEEKDFNNKLFEENKNIILNGFKSNADKTLHKTPILIAKINSDFSEFRIEHSNISLMKAIKGDDAKKIGSFDNDNREDDYYILGNRYNEKENDNNLRFSNLTFDRGELKDTTLNLKFFNNIRSLERRLSNSFDTKDISLSIGDTRSFEFSEIILKIHSDKINHLPDIKNILTLPPIYPKMFLRGFFDRQLVYASNQPYSGKMSIKRNVLDSFIIKCIKHLNGTVSENIIAIDNSLLEVRRRPFCNGLINIV
jgi:hypothetical protein